MTWQQSKMCQRLLLRNENILGFHSWSREVTCFFWNQNVNLNRLKLQEAYTLFTHHAYDDVRSLRFKCSLPSNYSFFDLFLSALILFRNRTILRKTPTFSNHYVTVQHVIVLQVLLKLFSNIKTQNNKSYLKDHSAETQNSEQTGSSVRNCKLRTNCDNLNVPLVSNTKRNTSTQNAKIPGTGSFYRQ
jgi:hypothetical protein